MIAIIDYGVGNLFSLCSSLRYIGREAAVTNETAVIQKCDKMLLPGVGAFQDAARKLGESGLGGLVIQETLKGKPLLGVCLGMQLLFEKSFEFGEHKGLGLLKGIIVPIKPRIPEDYNLAETPPSSYKVPHIGWNALKLRGDRKPSLLKYVNEGSHVYFVHSYHAQQCEDSIIATTEYGTELTAAVGWGNIFGTQFHPEKSGETGLNILRAFAEL